MRHVASFILGVVFAVGLVISGMTQPSKVVGFLDFFGGWDPSLACVMGGAVVVNGIAWALTKSKEKPVIEESFHVPTRSDITWQLLVGAALFGVGWGLAGYCPGPAITSVASGGLTPLVFTGAMALGVLALRWTRGAIASKSGPAAAD